MNSYGKSGGWVRKARQFYCFSYFYLPVGWRYCILSGVSLPHIKSGLGEVTETEKMMWIADF